MITHDDAGEEDDGFLTIEKRDHTLEDVGLAETSETAGTSARNPSGMSLTDTELSKRKIKMGESKKAMLKMKGTGHKLTFDDDGTSHEVYEMQGEDEFREQGEAEQQREEYLKAERERMVDADKVDRAVAREKRMEKKRKRKDREREVSWWYFEPLPIPMDVCLQNDFLSRSWLRRWVLRQLWVKDPIWRKSKIVTMKLKLMMTMQRLVRLRSVQRWLWRGKMMVIPMTMMRSWH